MNKFFSSIIKRLRKGTSAAPETNDNSNDGIISLYHQIRDEWKLIPEDEPNYALARKVFLEYNDFYLQNLGIHMMYLQFVPKSLLPYPKNYIKCAWYIFLESLKKEKDIKMFKTTQEIGLSLMYYPDYEMYKDNLTHKSMWDDVVFKDTNPSPRQLFKKLYGAYQISEEEYKNSPSSVDVSNERLIYDFGILPEIEEDI